MVISNAEQPARPYHLAPQQPPLLNTSPNRYTYFAHFYRCGDERLPNQHTLPHSRHGNIEDIYFSQRKAVQRDAAGNLCLLWWPSDEMLKSIGHTGAVGIGIHSANRVIGSEIRPGALAGSLTSAGTYTQAADIALTI